MSSAVGRASVSADSIDSSIWSSSLSSLSTSSLSDRSSSYYRRPSLEQQAQWAQAHAQSGPVSATPQHNMIDDQTQQASILSYSTIDTGTTATTTSTSNTDASSFSSPSPPKYLRNGGGFLSTVDESIEQVSSRELQLQLPPQNQDTQQRRESGAGSAGDDASQDSPTTTIPPSENNLSSTLFHTPPTSSSTRFANGSIHQDSNKMSPQSDTMTESKATLSGAVSPAGSRSSIIKDISAPYREHQLLPEPPIDEMLYGLVDRYGFLVEDGRQPSIERKRVSTNGSTRDSEQSLHMKHVALEQSRSVKWARMSKRYLSKSGETTYTFDHPKLTSRVYKGIPDCWRGAAWSYLITDRGRDANMDVKLRDSYPRLCVIPSPEEEQIDLDIPRTMRGHIMFKARYGSGQCALFNVLKAFSNHNSQVGYCQGMASVVATMLTFFDEEKAFVLLTHLFRRYNLSNFVIPGFPALFEAFYIQEELTKRYAPKISAALDAMEIMTASYASRWYITLFAAGVVPYRTLLRIWDVLFMEGIEWMYFVAIALLKYHEAKLIQNNFEQTMEMLNARMNIEDDDRLIKIARKVYRRAQRSNIVARLRKQYVEHERATKAVRD